MFRGQPPPCCGVSLTVKVVEKVAEQENVDPTELPPLADGINPDALDALFDPITNPGDSDVYVSFTYVGYTVYVYADCSVELK